MKKSTSQLILVIIILALSNSGIYFATAYSQMKESVDASSMIQTLLFATAAVSYLPLGIWMAKNRLHSRAPYVIASLISFALIGLYVLSRTIPLPVVGIQEDIGTIDVISKVTQGSIIVMSAILIRNWNKEKINVPQ
jgi:phosphoglycerol transferase MdoB-like AlkP superfamily enzyme